MESILSINSSEYSLSIFLWEFAPFSSTTSSFLLLLKPKKQRQKQSTQQNPRRNIHLNDQSSTITLKRNPKAIDITSSITICLTFMEYSMLFAKYKSKTNAKLVSSMKAKVTATGNSYCQKHQCFRFTYHARRYGLNFFFG